MTTFAPGTRVVVRNAGHLNGKTGVVLDGKPASGYETIVLLDEDEGLPNRELAFYIHELRVAS